MNDGKTKMTQEQRQILDYVFSRLGDDDVPDEHLRGLQSIADKLIIEYSDEWLSKHGE